MKDWITDPYCSKDGNILMNAFCGNLFLSNSSWQQIKFAICQLFAQFFVRFRADSIRFMQQQTGKLSLNGWIRRHLSIFGVNYFTKSHIWCKLFLIARTNWVFGDKYYHEQVEGNTNWSRRKLKRDRKAGTWRVSKENCAKNIYL